MGQIFGAGDLVSKSGGPLGWVGLQARARAKKEVGRDERKWLLCFVCERERERKKMCVRIRYGGFVCWRTEGERGGEEGRKIGAR